jgi:hypothetical protein
LAQLLALAQTSPFAIMEMYKRPAILNSHTHMQTVGTKNLASILQLLSLAKRAVIISYSNNGKSGK